MEVHHHSHTSDPPDSYRDHRGRKKWAHYFWEFLMLFLAVFCGFMAEYQLEHVIENQREKNYMQSLMEDLKRDTADINASIPAKEARIKAIDSVLHFFQEHGNVDKVPGDILYCIMRSGFDKAVERNRGTIDQLTNAGGLRLVRKQNVRDSIKLFDHDWEVAGIWRESYVVRYREHSAHLERLLSAWDLLSIYINNPSRSISESRNLSSVRIHREVLEAYINHLWSQLRSVNSDMINYIRVRDRATQLMNLIQREYQLK